MAMDRAISFAVPDAVSAATAEKPERRPRSGTGAQPGIGAETGGDDQIQQALERIGRARGRSNQGGAADVGRGNSSAREIGELFKQAEAAMKAEQFGVAYEYYATVATCRAVPGAEAMADRARARLLEIDKLAYARLEEARLARLQGKPVEALDILKELLGKYPYCRGADEARGLLESMSTEPRVAAEVAILKAFELDGAGKYAEAAAAYAAIVKGYPESVPALKAELRLRAMRENPEIAAVIAEGVASSGGAEAVKLLRQANNFHMNGLNDRARPLYEELCRKYPDSEEAGEAKGKLAEMPAPDTATESAGQDGAAE
jgi:tetratricopeptide (TPR) repeat protein